MTTIIIQVEDHARERVLAQLHQTEGVRVDDHGGPSPQTQFGEDYPYSKEDLVADVREALSFAREVKAGRKRGRPIGELLDEL